MTSITQTIPTVNGGISQQPDELKLPGQVTKAQNVVTDITEGLTKRPGSRLVSDISAATDGKWFSYYRDENEQYIGQIDRTGAVKIFSGSSVTNGSYTLAAGAEAQVIYNSTATEAKLKAYLNHNKDDDIQTLTLNDYTYINNRANFDNNGASHTKTTVAMSATKSPARQHECFVDLKKVAYANQYGLNIFDNNNTTDVYKATRLDIKREIDTSNSCENNGNTWPSNGNLPGSGGSYPCYKGTGIRGDSYCPNVGTKIFSVSHADSMDSAESNGASFSISVSANGGNASDRKNLYFRITTLGTAMPESDESSPAYYCRYTTTVDLLYGGEGWREGDSFDIWMKNARYKITVTSGTVSKVQANLALARPLPTPFDSKTVVSAESILGDLETEIVAGGNFTDADITHIGNGLHIKRNSAFSISNPNNELMSVMGDSCKKIEELPQQCKHGYRVRVSNAEDDEDDYYVKFFGNDDKDGPGVWEECPKWDEFIEYDKETMPIRIIRKIDSGDPSQNIAAGAVTGTADKIYFEVDHIPWENCGAGTTDGDSGTNPRASFVGKKISKMLFWRNRLILLSDEHVVMSRPGDFYNFWARTAQTYSNGDHIDLSCSSDKPAVIYDGIQTNSGLVLFTKTNQFLCATDSDILNPQTAKINSLCTYNFNSATSPISLGTTIGWLDNAGKNSRFFEITRVQREGEPLVVEQSKIVSSLFNKDLALISNSKENGLIFFSEKNSSTLYGYKYFNTGEQRLLQSWFTWELSGNVQYHTVLDDALYAVVRNGSNDVLQKFDLKLSTETRTVTDDFDTTDTTDDVEYTLHFDNSKLITASQLGYSSTTKRTGFTKPDGFDSTKQLAVYCHKASSTSSSSQAAQDSDLIGSYQLASVVGNPGNYNIEWDGDWTGHDIIVGYLFDMEVKFPKFYYTTQSGENIRSDVQGSLIIHRVNLNMGKSGLYDTLVQRIGKPDYTETWEPAKADAYNANQVDFTETVVQTVPTYEKNTNLTLSLKSSHPSPVTLYSMSWEGDFTTKFYRRV